MTRAPHFQPVTLNYSSDPFNPDCPGDGCHLLHFRDERVRSGGRGGASSSDVRAASPADCKLARCAHIAATYWLTVKTRESNIRKREDTGHSLFSLPPPPPPRPFLCPCLSVLLSPPPLPLLWLVVPCICAPGGRPVGTGFRGETIAVRILNGARAAGARAREAGQGAEAMG